SLSRNKYADFAVDGVLLYASFLAKEFDVLAIAASGEDKASLRISHFLHLRGQLKAIDWNVAKAIVPLTDYYEEFIKSDVKFRQDYGTLLAYSRKLNSQLHAHKITEARRGFLISGILIALGNRAFKASYEAHKSPKHLAKAIVDTISEEF